MWVKSSIISGVKSPAINQRYQEILYHEGTALQLRVLARMLGLTRSQASADAHKRPIGKSKLFILVKGPTGASRFLLKCSRIASDSRLFGAHSQMLQHTGGSKVTSRTYNSRMSRLDSGMDRVGS